MRQPILLLVGDDKISRKLLHYIPPQPNLTVAVDRSSSLRRIGKLIWKRSLRPSDVAAMGLAELRRPQYRPMRHHQKPVVSNADLLDLIRQHRPAQVYLFRASLIVGRDVLAEPGVEVFNVHSASIKTHGGLASIRRALKDGTYQQAACIHRVTSRIDDGEIVAERPYVLDPKVSYFFNEQTAYDAGALLALRTLERAGLQT